MDRIAAALRERGVRPGMALAGFFGKTSTMPMVFLAASRLGAVFTPLSFRMSHAEQRPLLSQLSIGAFFTELDHLSLLSTLRPQIRPEAPLVVLHGDPPVRGYLPFSELLQGATAPAPPDSGADAPVYLNLTSGTTGAPRAAVARHRNLHAATAGACAALGLTPEDVHLCLFAPFAHPHEVFARALFLGGTAVLHDSMSPKALANVIEKARVTCVMAVPPLYEVSLRPQLEARVYRTGSLRLLEAGGMPTPERLVRDFRDRFGLTVVPVWGSTETTGIALTASAESAPGLLGAVVPGFSMRVVREDGSAASDGEPGELWLQGDAVVSGYLGSASDPSLGDGAFNTGDLVRVTPRGIVFLGRRDDMRKVGGLKVFPQELEAHLQTMPGVREAAVAFREDRARGLAPIAILVMNGDAEPPSLTDVKRHLRGKVSSGVMPRAVQIASELPKTAAGKLDRKALAP